MPLASARVTLDPARAARAVRQRRKRVFALALVLWALAPSGESTSQAQAGGSVALRTGFTPDPARLEGATRGERRLDIPRGDLGCDAGFVATFPSRPSHIVELGTRMGFFRIYAMGETDLALAVRDAEGRWHCNDDAYGNHPSVEGTWTAGRVEVYVGTHTLGESGSYTLRLTEMRSMRPGAGSEGGEAADERGLARDAGLLVDDEEGRFDGIRLRRGFLPDPRFLAGHTEPEEEGNADISALGGDCHGFTPGGPAHIVNLLDDFDYLQLYVLPLDAERWPGDGPPNVSLLVLRPDGRFECERGDSDGVELDAPSWSPGIYRVWVGTTIEGVRTDYRLGISEIRRVR